jgi:hypothetical protein
MDQVLKGHLARQSVVYAASDAANIRKLFEKDTFAFAVRLNTPAGVVRIFGHG